MICILIDTNIFVGAAYNPGSVSRKIIQAVEDGEFRLVVSPAILREYEAVFPKAIRFDEARDQVCQPLTLAESVTPVEVPHVTEDRSDDKFLAAAVAAQADVIITSDAHLLAVHPYQDIQILRPSDFWRQQRGS